MKFKNNLSEKGVTLIELLVAVAIFAITMIAVSGILISAIKEQQKISARQALIDNERYVMGFMIKELRMARSIDIASKNGSFDNVTFINSAGNTVKYFWQNIGGKKRIMRNDSSGGGDQPISSDEVTIAVKDINFVINDWNLNLASVVTPVITIFIEMSKGAVSSQLQSTVSPRLY